MIPMHCPGCGRPGNIPPDKLNARMHCKKCDAVFYMDSRGGMILGEPPRPGEKAKKPRYAQTGPKKKAAGGGGGDGFNIGETLKDLPMAVKVGIPVAALAALIFFNVDCSGGPAESPVPKVQSLVRAALNGDKSSLASYTTKSTASESAQWADKVRADYGITSSLPSDAMIQPNLMAGNAEGDQQFYNVVVSGLKDSAGKDKTISLGVFIVEMKGTWYLDGKATYEESMKQKK